MLKMREEKDNLGKIQLPDEALYGIYSIRALDSFPISGERINLYLIKAMLVVKKAVCTANYKTGKLPEEKYNSIIRAIDFLLDETGRTITKESFSLYDKIIVDPYHGGAGVTLDMNINEIIANTALLLTGRKNGDYDFIHPYNDVNLSQSLNATFSSALKIAALLLVIDLSDAFEVLQKALREKEKEFGNIIKLGRTQLQDSTTITLGIEFGTFAALIKRAADQLRKGKENLSVINPVAGFRGNFTGEDTRFVKTAVEEIKNITGLKFKKADNLTDVVHDTDIFGTVHGIIKTGTASLIKICHDLRLLSSGPKGGLGEINLPTVLSDNDFIRGKNNHVILENTIQVCELVQGHDLVISNLVSAGNLESNSFMPLIAHLLLKSAELLRDSVLNLTEKCIRGIEADEEKCIQNLLNSSAIARSLVNIFGYEKIQKIVNESEEKGISFIELLKQKKILSEKELIGLISREMGIKGERRD